MSDESVHNIPEFDAMALLQARLASKGTGPQSTPSKGTIDPYQMMLKRKDANAEEVLSPVQTWPEADIKRLEEFCLKHGIVGFNCGRMSPAAALALLKGKLGVMDTPPKTEGYGPNYPYTMAMQKKSLLHG